MADTVDPGGSGDIILLERIGAELKGLPGECLTATTSSSTGLRREGGERSGGTVGGKRSLIVLECFAPPLHAQPMPPPLWGEAYLSPPSPLSPLLSFWRWSVGKKNLTLFTRREEKKRSTLHAQTQ